MLLTLDFAECSVAKVAFKSVVPNFDGEAHFITMESKSIIRNCSVLFYPVFKTECDADVLKNLRTPLILILYILFILIFPVGFIWESFEGHLGFIWFT